MPVEDPKDLDKIDQEIRINELKAEAEEITGCEMGEGINPDVQPEMEEMFWQDVVDIERGGFVQGHEELAEQGIHLPAPEEVKDEDLPALLAELLQRLGDGGTYVFHTNHMSDRELYEKLWRDSLNEWKPRTRPRSEMAGGFFMDMAGGDSRDSRHAYLKYYADEDSRRRHCQDWPDEELPPREAPPYDRDRTLPKPPDLPGGAKWY